MSNQDFSAVCDYSIRKKTSAICKRMNAESLLEIVIAFSGSMAVAEICLQAACIKAKPNKKAPSYSIKNKDIVPSYWIMQENEHGLCRVSYKTSKTICMFILIS